MFYLSFNYNFSKLHRYSPAEAAKVYEKSISRKQVPVFKPKVTLEALSQASPDVLSEEDKKNLVQQYLEVSKPSVFSL